MNCQIYSSCSTKFNFMQLAQPMLTTFHCVPYSKCIGSLAPSLSPIPNPIFFCLPTPPPSLTPNTTPNTSPAPKPPPL